MNDVTLHRHKDGSLAIAHAPEVFLCARPSLELLVAGHNQAIAAGNDARSEIKDLTQALEQRKKDYDHEREAHWQTLELYKTHHEEADRITKEILECRSEIRSKDATIESLTTQRDEAQNQAHNASLRADRAKRERDATAHALDKLRTDVKTLLTETDQQQELHAFDRHIAHVQRKIDFFHKHQELLKPRT